MCNIEDKIKLFLKIEKVRDMKNPIIVMNNSDFKEWKKKLESSVENFKIGERPKYKNIPIIIFEFIEKGNIVIYDDIKWTI